MPLFFAVNYFMPKLDGLKANVSFHEKMFFAAIAVILALLGWAVNQPLTIELWKFIVAALSLFAAIVFATWHYKKIKHLIKDIENA